MLIKKGKGEEATAEKVAEELHHNLLEALEALKAENPPSAEFLQELEALKANSLAHVELLKALEALQPTREEAAQKQWKDLGQKEFLESLQVLKVEYPAQADILEALEVDPNSGEKTRAQVLEAVNTLKGEYRERFDKALKAQAPAELFKALEDLKEKNPEQAGFLEVQFLGGGETKRLKALMQHAMRVEAAAGKVTVGNNKSTQKVRRPV